MKCGFGVCGQCAVDDSGECVCKKGTVMNYKKLKKLPEFGKYHRDAQGKKKYF
jgi:dihydroorotate dehydrogenase electron transfer subunit